MSNIFHKKKKSINISISERNLLEFCKIFKSIRIKYFLLYGTLLGIYRNKKLINYDNDIDIGCFNESFNKNKKIIIDKLKKKNFLVFYESNTLITFSKNKNYIDLYLFSKITFTGGRFAYLFYIPKKFLIKLKKIKFNNFDYLIPNLVEEFLTYCYGSDWKIPKPGKTAKTNLWLAIISKIFPTRFNKILRKIIF
jgi:phosphorylcholine metabolism protein LicD